MAVVRPTRRGTRSLRTVRREALVSALATIATIAIARTAEAAPVQGVDLDWRSDDPTCIDRATLARTVEATLGRSVFHADTAASASIEGTIGASPGGGFRAKITMRSASGEVQTERELSTSATSCDRMDESVAIVVALMVDGLEEKPAPLEVPPKLPRPPTPPTPAPPPALPRRVPAGDRRTPVPLLLEGELGGTIAFGLLPRPGPGTYLRVGLGVGHAWSLAVTARGFLASRTVGDGPGAVIRASVFDLNGCYAPVRASSLRLVGCLLLGGGWMDGTPVGTSRTESLRLPLAYGGMSFEASLRIAGPVWLHVRPSLWAPIESPHFESHTSDGTIHLIFKPWIVAPSVSLGVGGRFGS